MAMRRTLLFLLVPAVLLASGIAVKPEGAVRPVRVGETSPADREAVAAARLDFARHNPVGQWLVVSWTVEHRYEWREPALGPCSTGVMVIPRTLFGLPLARGFVHCSGKEVLWD